MNSHFMVKKKKEKKRFFGGFSKGERVIPFRSLDWNGNSARHTKLGMWLFVVFCLFVFVFYFVIRHEDIEITPNIANAKPRMNAGPNIEPKERIFGDDNWWQKQRKMGVVISFWEWDSWKSRYDQLAQMNNNEWSREFDSRHFSFNDENESSKNCGWREKKSRNGMINWMNMGYVKA